MSHLQGHTGASRSRSITAFLCGLLSIVLGSMPARADDHAPSPARLVPARGLIGYLESDGLDAHAEAWKATAAAKILNETAAGAIVTDVARQMLGQLLKIVPGHTLTGPDLVALHTHITHRGFALACYDDNHSSTTVLIFNDISDQETRDRFDRLLRFVLQPEEGQPLAATTRVRGRDVFVFQHPENAGGPFGIRVAGAGPTWWFEGETLILVKGPDADPVEALRQPDAVQRDLEALHQARVNAVLDAIEAKTPNATTHPGIVAGRAEGRDLHGFEPSGLFVAESVKGKGVLDEWRAQFSAPIGLGTETPNEFDFAAAMGLGQARRVIGRWGFRGKALLTDVRFEAPGPWSGMIGMLDPSGFPKNRVPPIPKRMGAFGVGSFSRALDAQSSAILGRFLKSDARPYFEAAAHAFANQENRQVIEDVLGCLGPTYCVYAAPGGSNKKEAVPAFLIGTTDAEKLATTLEAAAKRLNAYLRAQESGVGNAPMPADAPPALAFERLPGPDRGYRLTSPARQVPWLNDAIQPTIMLGKSFVAVAANPDLARAAIAAESQAGAHWELSGETATLFECLPANLSLLVVGNPRDSSWPEAIVGLPGASASFLENFLGVKLGAAQAEPRPSGLLSLLGVRRSGRATTLRADDLRSLLFPSIHAATVDDRGFRVLSLESLPLGCAWIQYEYQGKGLAKALSITVKFGPGN